MTNTTSALGERAMLVSLSVSIWSARKHDARISDKVAAEHGADRSMGRYAKHLIPRELLTPVSTANSALREHHNRNTLAWGDDGTRILPAANYLGYQADQQTLEDAFGRTVRDFVGSVRLGVKVTNLGTYLRALGCARHIITIRGAAPVIILLIPVILARALTDPRSRTSYGKP